MIQINYWSQFAGANHPYDTNKSYAIVDVDVPAEASKAAGIKTTNIKAQITPSEGIQIGYITDNEPPAIDWNGCRHIQQRPDYILRISLGSRLYRFIFSSRLFPSTVM